MKEKENQIKFYDLKTNKTKYDKNDLELSFLRS